MKKSLIILIILLIAGCTIPLGGADNKDLKLEAVKDKIIDSEEYTELICDGYKEEKTATGTAMVCDKWKEIEKVEYSYYDKEVTESLEYKGYDEKKELRGLNYEVYDKGNGQYVMRYQLGDDKYKKIDNKFYEVKTEKIDKDKYDSQTTTLTDKILSFFGGDALADTNTNSTNNKDTSITNNHPTYNYGATTYLTLQNTTIVNYGRVLINFTLPSVSGTISHIALKMVSAGAWTGTDTIEVHELSQTGWTEGSGNSTATNDGATWEVYDGTNDWTTDGGDFSATIVDSKILGNITQEAGTSFEFDVQGTGATNSLSLDWEDTVHLIMKCFNENGSTNRMQMRIHSKESATSGYRPYIEITYTAGGATPSPRQEEVMWFN